MKRGWGGVWVVEGRVGRQYCLGGKERGKERRKGGRERRASDRLARSFAFLGSKQGRGERLTCSIECPQKRLLSKGLREPMEESQVGEAAKGMSRTWKAYLCERKRAKRSETPRKSVSRSIENNGEPRKQELKEENKAARENSQRYPYPRPKARTRSRDPSA